MGVPIHYYALHVHTGLSPIFVIRWMSSHLRTGHYLKHDIDKLTSKISITFLVTVSLISALGIAKAGKPATHSSEASVAFTNKEQNLIS